MASIYKTVYLTLFHFLCDKIAKTTIPDFTLNESPEGKQVKFKPDV